MLVLLIAKNSLFCSSHAKYVPEYVATDATCDSLIGIPFPFRLAAHLCLALSRFANTRLVILRVRCLVFIPMSEMCIYNQPFWPPAS